jgi:hypothetical protein
VISKGVQVLCSHPMVESCKNVCKRGGNKFKQSLVMRPYTVAIRLQSQGIIYTRERG